MITNPTRHKLNEADHFIEEMKATFDDDNIFAFNLSAFLAAARSITSYMRKQYSYIDGFMNWYGSKQAQMSADPDFKFLNEARVETVHKEPVMTGSSREVTFTVDMIIGPANEKEIEHIKEADSKVSTQGNPNTVRRFFPEYYNTDVIEFCEKQLDKLNKLVDECEQQFY